MSLRLKGGLHKWQFALIIALVNVFAQFVLPYLLSKYLPSGVEGTLIQSGITLLINIILVILTIEENNAPTKIVS
jgi:hypothetical protein